MSEPKLDAGEPGPRSQVCPFVTRLLRDTQYLEEGSHVVGHLLIC